MREQEGFLVSADGMRIFWRAWLADQPRGVLALIHGLGGHSGWYRSLAEALTSQGWSCYGVDLRGMGRSPGRRGHARRWQQWIDDVTALYQLACNENPGLEVVPMGHSFGGVLLLTAILSGSINPQRFVLSNPALRIALKVPSWKLKLGWVADRLLPILSLPTGADPELAFRDPQQVKAFREDPLTHHWISARLHAEWAKACQLALSSEIKLPYLLILSGNDRLVDPSGGQELAAHSCNAVVKLYPELFHDCLNDCGKEEVFADLSSWLSISY